MHKSKSQLPTLVCPIVPTANVGRNKQLYLTIRHTKGCKLIVK